jgi:MoaA/NifB/PqqE/SkfB family radical SAM enzyme
MEPQQRNSIMSQTSESIGNGVGAGVGRFLWKALSSRHNPLLAQMVVTRRCNLSCGYCNEYDDFSPPVPFELLAERVEALYRLNTAAVTCTGGEPLMNPGLTRVIRLIREKGMIATMITNGYRLNEKRILELNDSGLQEMQISIDNLVPDDVSQKSLKAVESKLGLLSKHASFKVNVNSVLGISDERTEDALEVAETAKRFGFFHSVGVLHDETGRIKPFSERQFQTYRRITGLSHSVSHSINYRLFQKNLMHGRPNAWKCRAGARYLYICEDGKVHLCSQRRGYPGVPVTQYTREDVAREFDTRKDCAPYCTLSCVHQMSAFDALRRQNTEDHGLPAVPGVRALSAS